MIVGVVRLRIHIPHARSLKDKRQVVRSILARLRNDFHVSAAEVGEQDRWQLAELGLAYVSGESGHANEVLSKAVDAVQYGHWDAEFLDYQLELIPVS